MSITSDQFVLSEKEQGRRSYRRSRKRRSALIAVVSTVVVTALVVVGVTHTPGWSDFKQSFLDRHIFTGQFGNIGKGFLIDMKLFVIAEPIVLVVALVIAVLRTSSSSVMAPARIGCAVYVDIFRGTPMIILLFLIGLGVPSLQLKHVTNSVTFWGGVAIIVGYSAYVTEVIRAGIVSVHPSQQAAARSLGLTPPQTMRLVILPQAVRSVVPALLNDLVALTKDVGLASIVGAVPEAISRATGIEDQIFNFTPYVLAAFLFILVAAPLGRLSDWYTIRTMRRQGWGGDVMTDHVLDIRGLHKHYGDTRVLNGIDLTIDEGKTVVLIGGSGSGKSTLLKCANLLEQATDGEIWFDGKEISDPRINHDAVRRRIGVVFQAYNLFPHMTALRNVALAPRRIGNLSKRDAEDRARELLARVGLADKADSYPERLSGGQQQRVAIARALANEPRLLLLDEITSALDPELVGEVLDLIGELKAQGMTILMATHEMGFARRAADRVCYLEGGKVAEHGSPSQILDSPNSPRLQQFLSRVLDH